MKSARLSRDSGPIDQNQTAGTVSDDDRMFQNNRHAVKSRILLWEGVNQGEIMTENTTDCGQLHKPHGLTGNMRNQSSRDQFKS